VEKILLAANLLIALPVLHPPEAMETATKIIPRIITTVS